MKYNTKQLLLFTECNTQIIALSLDLSPEPEARVDKSKRSAIICVLHEVNNNNCFITQLERVARGV